MGHGIAYAAMSAGYDTRMFDVSEASLEKGRTAIDGIIRKGVELGKLQSAYADAVSRRLVTTSKIDEALDGADLVIEAAPERIDLKLSLFADIDRFAPPSAMVATNTSALSITEMAGSMKRPARVAGMHFFNPVHKMKLIEIVQALETAPDDARGDRRGLEADGEGDGAGPRVSRFHHHPGERQPRERGVLHARWKGSPRPATSTRR